MEGPIRFRREIVDVSPWFDPQKYPDGVKLWVHSPSGTLYRQYQSRTVTIRGKRDISINTDSVAAGFLAVGVLHDDDGNRFFKPKDAERVGKLDGGPLDRIEKIVKRMMGGDDDDTPVGNAVKN